jgi:hypothetical protein
MVKKMMYLSYGKTRNGHQKESWNIVFWLFDLFLFSYLQVISLVLVWCKIL